MKNLYIILLLTFGLGQDYSLYFDGNAGFRAPALPIVSSDWTIEMWFKAGPNAGQGTPGHLMYWSEGANDCNLVITETGSISYRVHSNIMIH